MVTKSSREMQKDREKIRPPFGGLKFYQGTHYLPLTIKLIDFGLKEDHHPFRPHDNDAGADVFMPYD